MKAVDLKKNRGLLILCLLIPLAVGGLSALLTGGGMERFEVIRKPPLTPPGWIFPPAWSILYLLMGLASYMALTSGREAAEIRAAHIVYGVQLAMNLLWSLFFFNLSTYLFSLLWLVALWLLILLCLILFCRLKHAAGWLMLPYLIWVAFAGYLNLGVYLLN